MTATKLNTLKRMWTLTVITIALSTARVACASSSDMALSEEKIQMSNVGTLEYGSLSDLEKMRLFKKYEQDCKRKYLSTAEERDRFALFEESLLRIDALNENERALNSTVVYGVTNFADLTVEEFQATYLGTKPPAGYLAQRRLMKIAPAVSRPMKLTAVDWRGIYTTPIKYQGGCGSCWAFAGVQQIESDAIYAKLITTSTILSVQQMVKCTYDYDGCNGGFTQTGYGYVAKTGGITTEALYPYDVTTSYCDRSKNNYAVTVTMSYRVEGEQAMINQILAGRTLAVSIDANELGSYKSGIYSGCGVNYNVNHAMQIVGVNVEEGYWILRNSWGTWWGDNGYMKLGMGSNMCGVNNYATYTDAAPVGSTYGSPTQSPKPLVPVGIPSAKPVTPPTPAPVVQPVTPPTPAPVVQPVTVPTAQPVTVPVAQPVTVPVARPVTVPSKRPFTPPVLYLTRRPTRPRTPRAKEVLRSDSLNKK